MFKIFLLQKQKWNKIFQTYLILFLISWFITHYKTNICNLDFELNKTAKYSTLSLCKLLSINCKYELWLLIFFLKNHCIKTC